MAIFDLAPAIEISRKIVREKTNQVVLRLVPDTKTGQVAADRTFGLFLVGIFTIGLLALLVINTARAEDVPLMRAGPAPVPGRREHRFRQRPSGIREVRVVGSDFHRLTELPVSLATPSATRFQAPTNHRKRIKTGPPPPTPDMYASC